LRGEGMGARTTDVIKALDDQKGVTAVALDGNTIALGDTPVVTEMSDISQGLSPGLDATEEDERLILELTSAGPLWAWVPRPSDNAKLLLGPALSKQASAVGAVLQPGEKMSALLRIHAADPELADRVEASLDAARASVAAQRGKREQSGVVNVLDGLMMEMMRGADPERTRRLKALKGHLGTLRPEARDLDIPVLGLLGSEAGGWALQRESVRVLLTADLEAAGLGLIASELTDLLR
ncbi:MAG: hypothetical protein VX938_07470, partial [Myxococcota bacterium]|nr:hypothetical protein [Myxococcota bacterium]